MGPSLLELMFRTAVVTTIFVPILTLVSWFFQEDIVVQLLQDCSWLLFFLFVQWKLSLTPTLAAGPMKKIIFLTFRHLWNVLFLLLRHIWKWIEDFYTWLNFYRLKSSESSTICQKLEIGLREQNSSHGLESFLKIFFFNKSCKKWNWELNRKMQLIQR